MAKGQHFSRHQQGIVKRYFEHKDTILITKLSELVSELYVTQESTKRERLWESVARALVQSQIDPHRMGALLKGRSVEQLAALVTELTTGGGKPASASASASAGKSSGSATPAKGGSSAVAGAAAPTNPPKDAAPAANTPSSASPPASAASSPPGGEALAPEQLRAAFKAFKKRLKLTRLDDESKIGRSPLTGGGSGGIVAIQPPSQFPAAVWEELVRQGRLKRAGSGCYELV